MTHAERETPYVYIPIPRLLTDEQRAVLRDIDAQGETSFFAEYSLTRLYRQLVMMGLARCRVDGMRNEFVRLTDEGIVLAREMSREMAR